MTDSRFPAPSTHDGVPSVNLEGCIDLHMHSTCSDGAHPPEFLVEWAHQLGLRAIAITDHDNTNGVDRAIAKANELSGIEVIPGCEITVGYSGGTFHLLGYYVDHHNEAFNKAMAEAVAAREERNNAIIAALAEHGMPVTLEEVLEIAGEAVVGRPHIAKAMLKHGYVENFRQAFDLWLGDDKPCYFHKDAFTPQDAIELVLLAGGVPVLAHPKWLNKPSLEDLDAYISELVEFGLRGIEVVYSDHDSEEQQGYKAIAKKYGLIVTGGSDFHGGGVVKPEVTIGHGTGGSFHVPGSLLGPLKAAAQAMR